MTRSPVTSLQIEARLIADDLLTSAHENADGTITWGRGYGISTGQPVADAGMFNGRIGEAFFLAALYSDTGIAAYAAGARRAAQGLRISIAEPLQLRRLLDEVDLGLVGCGSIMYGLMRIGSWLEDPDWFASAAIVAQSITPELVESDRRLDFFSGSAGLLHGLLAVYESGILDTRSTAAMVGDHLVRSRTVDVESGLVAWRTLGDVPWAGFAHGSCGIASALLRLGLVVPDPRYAAAAFEAFAFERLIRDTVSGDWPDSREKRGNVSGWCHGAGGVALSRLLAVNLADGPTRDDIASDLEMALTRTIADQFRMSDHLCCGTFGRVDILLEASLVLGNHSLRKQALSIADLARANARTRGFRLGTAGHYGTQCDPGFWQGAAGIGYALLRLSDPNRWPCVLRFA